MMAGEVPSHRVVAVMERAVEPSVDTAPQEELPDAGQGEGVLDVVAQSGLRGPFRGYRVRVLPPRKRTPDRRVGELATLHVPEVAGVPPEPNAAEPLSDPDLAAVPDSPDPPL